MCRKSRRYTFYGRQDSMKLCSSPVGAKTLSHNRLLMMCGVLMCRWDRRLTVSVPEGEVFYIVAFLRNALPSSGPTLKAILDDNDKILHVCEALSCKQYLPRHHDQAHWEQHFGSQWDLLVQRKHMFDPHAILSPGQNIFPRRPNLLLAST